MNDLSALVAAELAQPVDPRVSALAAAIAARHGRAARAVLFYGSCLRSRVLDGLMLDFYLIVSDYRAAYDRPWLAPANRLLPPNVFLVEDRGLAAKYAVLSLADFHRLTGIETRSVSVWARFAQPSRLVWRADAPSSAAVVAAVARAAPTLLATAAPLLPPGSDDLDRWRHAFALTYGAELRAERSGRAASVVDDDPDRYRRFTAPALATAAALPTLSAAAARRQWRRRRREGKLLTLARLAKASLTVAGGIDYLAWKINRHAGAGIVLRPWQRRHPLLGALVLLPRLIRGGAIR